MCGTERQRCQHALLAEHCFFDGRVVGQHRDDDFAAAGFRDAARQPCALSDQLVGLGGGAVVDGDCVTRVDEVGGHAVAHPAQADESDVHGFHHALVPARWRYVKPVH